MEEKIYSEKPGRRWDENIKYILNKWDVGMWPN